MTTKDKIILIILSVITFGIYPLVVLRKKNNEVNKKLSFINKVTIDIPKLQSLLGNAKNIVGCEYTHTKVKVFLRDKTLANVEDLQNLKGVSGVVMTSKSVTIIVGKQAKALANKI